MTGRRRLRNSRFFVGAGGALVILTIAGACANNMTAISEIDAYQAAVTRQSSEKALVFINSFPTSHLIGDVIESLPPDVALQTCAQIQESARTTNACQRAREIIAATPAKRSNATEIADVSDHPIGASVGSSNPPLDTGNAMVRVKQKASPATGNSGRQQKHPQYAIAEIQLATVEPTQIDEALAGAGGVKWQIAHQRREGGGVRGGR